MHWRMSIAAALHYRAAEGGARSAPCARHDTFGRFTKSTCAPNAVRSRTFMPFGSLRGRVKASRFAMRALSQPCATSAEEQAFRFMRTVPSHASQGVLETTGNIKVAQEILGFTPEHDSRFIHARRSACNGHCVGGGGSPAPSEPRGNARGHQLKLHSTPSL